MHEAKLHRWHLNHLPSSPAIRVAVKCPRCGAESLAELQIAKIAEALILEAPIRVHAACHNEWWSTTFAERQHIRERLIAYRNR
jgi:hypothetical protein